jgi:hypothetical protein
MNRWSDRREVIMINTFMEHEMVPAQSNNPRNARLKPATVLKYNKTMGAVDDVDRQLAPYENCRKTIKWYKKVAFRIIKWAVYQAFRIYLHLHPHTNITCKEFIRKTVEQIFEKYRVIRPAHVVLQFGRLRDTSNHMPEKVISDIGKQKKSNCVYCKSVFHIRKETAFKCSCCGKRLCIQGRDSCFKLYHLNN